MLLKLLFLFIVVPLVELVLLLELHSYTSTLITLGIVVGTGILGTILTRSQGMRTMRRIRDSLGRGESPGNALIDGGLILFAGALLLTPGILTDGLGFLLLFPPTRALVRESIKRRLQTRFTLSLTMVPQDIDANTVDSYVIKNDARQLEPPKADEVEADERGASS